MNAYPRTTLETLSSEKLLMMFWSPRLKKNDQSDESAECIDQSKVIIASIDQSEVIIASFNQREESIECIDQ